MTFILRNSKAKILEKFFWDFPREVWKWDCYNWTLSLERAAALIDIQPKVWFGSRPPDDSRL